MLPPLKMSASAFFTVSKSLFNGVPNLFTQQVRTTMILKRKYPIRLYPKGGKPHRMRHRDFIYDVVENTSLKKRPPLDIILTQYVEGVGDIGDKISLKAHKAYNDFLLPGLAVYASPENIEKYLKTDKDEQSFSSKFAPMTQTYLSQLLLNVAMSIETPWILEKWHIRANFRRILVHVTDDAITMPEKEIKGPNLINEGREFYVTITINKTESVKVRCRIRHNSADVAKQLASKFQYNQHRGKPIFPEDKEILDSMPKPKIVQITLSNSKTNQSR